MKNITSKELKKSYDLGQIFFLLRIFYIMDTNNTDKLGFRKPPLFIDLAPYLDGTHEQELPTVGATWSNHFLFYAGRLNEIHAEPATGKTNILLVAAMAVLKAGGAVLYIDPEDTPGGIVTRLLLLRASADDIRERFNYLHNPDPKNIKEAQAWAKKHKPEIVILDGLAESIATQGLNEDKAGDVLAFFRENLRPFTESGAAVVIADHVSKSTEGRGQFARGSGAKAGRYDGVSYEIVVGEAYTPYIEGYVKLKIQKDRNGGVGPRGKIVAELHFTPGTDGTTITEFREPAEKPVGQAFMPTTIMDKIINELADGKVLGKRELRKFGKAQYADRALDILQEEGRITRIKEGYFLTPTQEKKE